MCPPGEAVGITTSSEGISRDGPEVSVLIANFNNESFIADALGSALAQTVLDLEVIIVDDGSTDRSIAIIEQIRAREGDRVKLVIQDKQSGPGAARNRALMAARGRWVAILDGDDLMEPWRLRSLIDRAVEAGADMIADDLVLFYQDGGRPPHRHLGDRYDGYDRPIDLVRYIDENHFYAKRPTLGYLKPVWRTDRWRDSGVLYNPDLRIGEDYDLMVRLLRSGLKFTIAPVAGYRYRRHSKSVSHRIGGTELEALMAAGRDFAGGLGSQEHELALVLRRRERSIQDGLAYDALVNALRAVNLVRAARILLARPRIAPLLWDPVAVRIDRLRALLDNRPRPKAEA